MNPLSVLGNIGQSIGHGIQQGAEGLGGVLNSINPFHAQTAEAANYPPGVTNPWQSANPFDLLVKQQLEKSGYNEDSWLQAVLQSQAIQKQQKDAEQQQAALEQQRQTQPGWYDMAGGRLFEYAPGQVPKGYTLTGPNSAWLSSYNQQPYNGPIVPPALSVGPSPQGQLSAAPYTPQTTMPGGQLQVAPGSSLQGGS